jgi:hypothetical protein
MGWQPKKSLTMAQRRELEARWKPMKVWGTPEKMYADSGFWEFLKYVKTMDEHDQDKPIKPFPLDKPYVVLLILFLLALPVFAVPKSRQMIVSWTVAAFCVWVAWRRDMSLVIYQTQKEDDAKLMVSKGEKDPNGGRMSFIINHLPGWIGDPLVRSGQGNKINELVHISGSHIIGVPKGADQVRGKTATLFVPDEMAFQEDAESAWGAIVPAIAHGGRAVLISTVNAGSFFNQMTDFPEHEDPTLIENERYKWMDRINFPKGTRFYESATGMPCLEIHYSADMDKDPDTDMGRLFVEETSKLVGGVASMKWRQEYEIDRNAGGGGPVFPFLIDQTCPIYHPMLDTSWVRANLKLYAGYDWGYRSPAAFVVWGVDAQGRAYSVWEYHKAGDNYMQQKAAIRSCPYYDILTWRKADPSFLTKVEQTPAGPQLLSKMFAEGPDGVTFTPARRGCDVSTAHRFLSHYWADPKNPLAFLTAATPRTNKEFMRLRWKESKSESYRMTHNESEEIVQKDNHGVDATFYLFDALPGGPAAAIAHPGRWTIERAKKLLKQRENERRLEGQYV